MVKVFFKFTVMPFGLIESSKTKARLMDIVLDREVVVFCFVYLDDIIVATSTFEVHVKVFKEIAKSKTNCELV